MIRDRAEWISIHALREEGDARCCRARSFLAGFLSTPSARRATCTSGRSYPDSAISIHALREEGDNCSSLAAAMTGRISIHALREEGDRWLYRMFHRYLISIHALREEGDHGFGSLTHLCWKFLSTPSARRATMILPMTESRLWLFLSTPSARRATRAEKAAEAAREISIHALREEGDLPWLSLCSAIGKFLSTPSARRATDAPLIWATSLMYFYPRPLRGGRRFRPCSYTAPWYFYPRPLRGGRQPSVSAPGCNYIFLSTPSARRATGESCHRGCRRDISIHALCEEGDPRLMRRRTPRQRFLSTPSARRATPPWCVPCSQRCISIHALCEEGDDAGINTERLSWIFLSTPSARRATSSM